MRRILIALALAGCTDDGTGKYDDGGSGPTAWIDEAQVGCDPTASTWDDLFYFEAWTSGAVREVVARVLDGGDELARVALDEADRDYWYGEEWADDLDSDCDEFYQLRFLFELEASDGSEDSLEVH